SEFDGLPDADVVQFAELPLYTGSWFTYLTEVFRIGYQLEQRAFGRFRYPLYAWGGGIAIRQSLEETVTWDAATITEDTDFVWRAADRSDLEFSVVDAKFRNQAPPSLRAMLSQRRRWMSGTRQSSDALPTRYRGLLATRIVSWGFSPLIPLLSIVFFVFSPTFANPLVYQVGSLAQFGLLFVITGAGAYVYRQYSWIPLLAVVATPLLVIANTAGALWGVLSPIEEFAVTEKVPPERLERVHPDLEPGAFEDHDVEEPFAVAD
ncbi:MAG: glycosyltransferase, partial [Halanaeroarchaeum sp.]